MRGSRTVQERLEVKSLRPTHHRLHWRLDVTMNEDAARNRMDNGPHNLAVLRHMALNVMGREESKTSLRAKFKKAAWNTIISSNSSPYFEMRLPGDISLKT